VRKFFGVLTLLVLFGACHNMVNGNDGEPAASAPKPPPTGNLSSDYEASLGYYVTLPDGRREEGCSVNPRTVYDGAGTCRVGGETVVITLVIDGDTVELADGRRVRILGVDAPEVGTCAADAAAAYTRDALIGNRHVVLHRERGVAQDQDGRELGHLQCVSAESDTDKFWAAPASRDIGAGLAQYGWADVYEGGGVNSNYGDGHTAGPVRQPGGRELDRPARGGPWARGHRPLRSDSRHRGEAIGSRN
jgi:endonuclease YncB( thermonuclease family)